jgi:hypothetical protein
MPSSVFVGGIRMSTIAQSGRLRATARINPSASAAVSTTSIPALARTWVIPSRVSSTSSATTTRILRVCHSRPVQATGRSRADTDDALARRFYRYRADFDGRDGWDESRRKTAPDLGRDRGGADVDPAARRDSRDVTEALDRSPTGNSASASCSPRTIRSHFREFTRAE